MSIRKVEKFTAKMNRAPERAFEVIFDSEENAEKIGRKFFKNSELSRNAEVIVVDRIVSLLFQEKETAKKAASWFEKFEEVEVMSLYEGWALDNNFSEGVAET